MPANVSRPVEAGSKMEISLIRMNCLQEAISVHKMIADTDGDAILKTAEAFFQYVIKGKK